MKGKFWLYLFLIGAGLVAGALAAEITADVPWLSWLGFSLSFGTPEPFELDLNIVRLTFGISVKLTVSAVLFIALALILGRLILKKE